MGENSGKRVCITNLEHKYCYASPAAAIQSGYDQPEKMLGTTVFDLKTEAIKIADFAHSINLGVIKTKQTLTMLDIAKYESNLNVFVTVKKPHYDSVGNFFGVHTHAQKISHEDYSSFIYDLFQQAKKLDCLDKLGGIAYEIVEGYDTHGLSKAESKVLFLLAHGKTFVQAAEILSRSARTVEGHTDHIKEKLNLRSKSDVIEYAIYTQLNRLMPKGLL